VNRALEPLLPLVVEETISGSDHFKHLLCCEGADNAIDAEIVNGQYGGNRIFIPRIHLSPSKDIITLPSSSKGSSFDFSS
jgi:hypothetical protein